MGEAKDREKAGNGADVETAAAIAELEQKTCPHCGKLKSVADGTPDLGLLQQPLEPVMKTMDGIVVQCLGVIQNATMVRNARRYLLAGHATTGMALDVEAQMAQSALGLYDTLRHWLEPILRQRAAAGKRGFGG